jgi:SAM-dependent methyltransferase
MASAYNTNASNQGLSPFEMSAAAGNLLDPSDPSPAEFQGEEWFNFDLAVVGLGFHHFEDPVLAAKRLGERLKKGGVLMIMDFLPHDPKMTNETVVTGGGDAHGHGHGHRPSEKEPNEDSKERMKKVMGTVAHHGFDKEEVKKAFEPAGVGHDFGFDVIAQNVVFVSHERKMTRTIFLAKGRKL